MTEFVDDDVISKVWRKKRDTVVEVEVAFSGARTPAGRLVADGDFFVGKIVDFIKMREAGGDEGCGGRFVKRVFGFGFS